MSKMNIDELFNCPEGEMPEQLPLLTAEERNRLYKMSERKYNKDTDEKFVVGDSVSGVERYSRPVWMRRLASVAAAGVLLAGSGGLAYYIKNGSLDGFNENTAVDMISPSSQKDFEEIARYLLDGYTEFCTRIECPQCDPNTIVTLRVGDGEVQIARVIDEKIKSIDDFRVLGAKFMTEEYLNNNFDLSDAIDKSSFKEGESYSPYDFYAEDANARFFLYNDKLYTYYTEYNFDINEHITYDTFDITEKGEDSFTVKVVFNSRGLGYDSMPSDILKEARKNKTEKPYVFEVVRTDEEGWRIASGRLDEEKLNVQHNDPSEVLDVSETCKSFSDRYIQLHEYIYNRYAETDNYLNVTMRIGDKEVGRKYFRIEDDNSNPENVFWNAHTIDEIKQLSGFDDSYFERVFGSQFYKLDDGYCEGDVVSVEFENPDFIEYNGHLYSECTQEGREMLNAYNDYALFAPFTDEPEIVRVSDNEIVFRRKTGYRSNIAELNVMPFTFEFMLCKGMNEGDEWKLSGMYYDVASVELMPVNESTQEFEQLIIDYNKLANALCSNNSVDDNDTVSYWLTSQKEGIFRKYTNTDYSTPSQLEEEINRLFTADYIERNCLLGDNNNKLWTDRDFGDTPDGYLWAEEYGASELNTPFGYYFIYSNGEVYKSPTAHFMLLFFSDAKFTVHIEKKSDVNCVADVISESIYMDSDSEPITIYTKLRITFKRDGESWKIQNIDALEQ